MRCLCGAVLCSTIVLACLAQGQEKVPREEKPTTDKANVLVDLETGGHTGTVIRLFFSRDGKELVSVGRDNTVRFWSTGRGELLRTVRFTGQLHPEGFTQAAAVSADRRTLVVNARLEENKSGKRPLLFINLDEGKVERVLWVGPARGHLVSLALSPDGTKVATGHWEGAYVWDAKSGDKLQALEARAQYGQDKGQSLTFSPDSKQLAVLMDTNIHVLDVEAKKLTTLPAASHLYSLFWSPDATHLAIAHRNGVSLVNPATGKGPHAWSSGITTALEWGAKSDLCVAAGVTSTGAQVSLLKIEKEKGAKAKAKEIRSFKLPSDEEGKATAVALSVNGGLVAAACEPDHAIRLWNRKGELQHTFVGRGGPFHGAGWTADGKTIGWGRSAATVEQAFDLAQLRLRERKGLGKFRSAAGKQGDIELHLGTPSDPPRVHTAGKAGAALNLPIPHAISGTLLPEHRVALGNPHGAVYLFENKGGWPIARFSGHRAAIKAISPSPDGKWLLSASEDQTLKVWNLAKTGPEALLLTFFEAGGDWIAWTPQGYYAASAGGERLMGWRVRHGVNQLDSFYPAERFRKVLWRPDVIQLVLAKGDVKQALTEANARAAANAAKQPKTVKQPKDKPPPKVQPAVKVEKAEDVEQLVPPTGKLEVLSTDGPKVKVRATGTASKGQRVEALSLRVNGRTLGEDQFSKEIDPKGKPEATWTVELPPGKHVLDVLVRGPETADVSEPVTVGVEPPEDQKPTLFCLPIGLNYGWDAKLKDLKLDAAENDARTLLGALKANCAGKGNRFKEVQGKPLLGEKATKAAILAEVKGLRAKGAKPGDLVVLFYAGHGVAQGRSFYLLTADVPNGSPDSASIARTCLSGAELHDAIRELRCQVLVIFDACHSGKALPAFVPATDEVGRSLSDDEAAVWVLAAAMAHETAGEEKGNGRLTSALAEVLRAGPGTFYDPEQGVMNVQHVYAKVTDLVQKSSKGRQNPQLLPPWTSPPLIVRKIPAKPAKP